MQNFDLLDFLSHNYISLGTLANRNMWHSYCYGDPNSWWWHLQEEANMSFGNTTYYFTGNNRYRVSIWTVLSSYDSDFYTFYLYIEDLKLARVWIYVSTLVAELPTNGFLKPDSIFQNLSIEITDSGNVVLHSYTWDNTMTLLKGQQAMPMGLFKSLLIFDSNEALLYLYDGQRNQTSVPELVIHLLSFSSQSTSISGITYRTSEVTYMTSDARRLYEGLNNTHIYISNLISYIPEVKITKNNLHIVCNVINLPSSYIVRPLGDDFPWFILFVFRPTPVGGDSPENYDVEPIIQQSFTGNHSPITRWKLDNGEYSLSIDCGGIFNDIFIQYAFIITGYGNYFAAMRGQQSSLYVTPDINPIHIFTRDTGGYIHTSGGIAAYRTTSSTTSSSCGISFASLFHYYGDNTENLIWLFHYNGNNNTGTAHIIYLENMHEHANLITAGYRVYNIYFLGLYNKIFSPDIWHITIKSYLSPYEYYNHDTSLFIYNTLSHTAPQVVNGSWSYMHYLRFVLDDYTSSNLRIPLAIVEGDIRKGDIIKYRAISIDKMSTSQRYPIVQLGPLSKAQMPDVVLDGYIASLNADAGKNEDSSFGTLVPYYDLKEAKIQEPHPEWYFRIHIHAGTWYCIFNNIMSDNNNQMKTYRIQHNDGSLRIVLDVGLYFEILTEPANGNNKKYTIVYADLFPSVYWCYESESYEFLNINVEWIQCRYSMPGSSMVRARPNNIITEQSEISL